MLAWYHFRATICRILWTTDERRGSPSLCEAAPGVGMWEVWRVFGHGIHGRPPPYIARPVRMGQSATSSIASPYVRVIPGGLPADGHIHQLPY